MKRHTLVMVAVLAAALAWVAVSYSRHVQRVAALRIDVAGGDGGGLPLAQPELEHFEASALERATHDPAAAGLEAFVVMRHGHVVLERFAHGANADTLIDVGPSSRVLVALLAGVEIRAGAVALPALGKFDASAWRDTIEHATDQRYAELLAHKVWARLNSAPAWIALPSPGAVPPVDCCFHTRIQDWMRLGALLVDAGNFEGTQVVEASWVSRMLQPASADGRRGLGVELNAAARGTARFEASDLVFLRGPGHWRVWAVPSLRLVVLFGSVARRRGTPDDAAQTWDETRLPNLVIDAVTDRTAPQNSESLLQRLVPHH